MARILPVMMILMIGLFAVASFADDGEDYQKQNRDLVWDDTAPDAFGGIHRNGGDSDDPYFEDGEPHGDINLDGVGPLGPGPDGSGMIVIITPLI
jgi:hypothetical protein